MLRYSYEVELERAKIELAQLELDLKRNPNSKRLKDLIQIKREEIAWLEKKIDDGEDPGMRII